MDSLVVDLPYPYRFSCVPPRCRKERTFTAFDVAPFEISSLSSEEAPVTMAWGGLTVRTIGSDPFVPAGDDLPQLVQERLRLGATGLWSDIGYRFPAADALLRDYGYLADHLVVDIARRTWDVGSGSEKSTMRNVTPGPVRRVVEMREEGLAYAARAWRRTLALVDGKPWVSTYAAEPHYAIYSAGYRRRAGMDVSVDPWGPDVALARYPADRLDDAIRHSRRLFTRNDTPWGGFIDVRSKSTFEAAIGTATCLRSLLTRPLRLADGAETENVTVTRLAVLTMFDVREWLRRDHAWAMGTIEAASRYLDLTVSRPEIGLDMASLVASARALLAAVPVEVDETDTLVDMDWGD